MEDLYNKLNLKFDYTVKDGILTADMKDSNEFSQTYFKLSNSNEVEVDPDNFELNADTANIKFTSEFYDIKLEADFNDNKYKLIMTEAK